MWHSTKRCFFRFLIKAPNAQNLLPKNLLHKMPISRFVWPIDHRCLHLPGGFRGWLVQWNHTKCCGADPCCHGNKIFARRCDPVAYRLVLLAIIKWFLKTYMFGYVIAVDCDELLNSDFPILYFCQ